MKKKREEEEEEEEKKKVMEYLRKEVKDWDEDEKVRVRYKGMSGQSSDYEWQSLYIFWKELIINVSRHLKTFIIRPQQLKFVWFQRCPGPIYPLCLDLVLVEMCKNGELLPFSAAADPSPRGGTPLPLILRNLLLRFLRKPFNPQNHQLNDSFIISSLLKEKCVEVVSVLSETHWTPSCIITLNKFHHICGGGLKQASAVLTHLSLSRSATHLSIQTKDLIEGVKVAISPGADCSITSLDYDVLRLVSTVERLEQQLNVIDCRWKKFKSLALASLKSGDRTVALRHARELKLASQGREKCASLLNQVEDVLRVIADAESSKKVSEAIIIGARAIKENSISAEEVELALEELDESIASQQQVDKLLESTPSYNGNEDEDIEDELRLLELDMNMEEAIQAPANVDGTSAQEVDDGLDIISGSLSSELSGLKLRDDAAQHDHVEPTSSSISVSKNIKLKLPESFV